MPLYYRLSRALAAALLVLAGCRSAPVDDSEYAMVAHALDHADLGAPAESSPAGLVVEDLAGPHAVGEYLAYALANNPAIHAARHRLEAAQQRVPQAESLDDPMLGVMGFPFFPNVPQTASGRATAGITASQKFPWFGKLELQGDAARAETDVARAELVAAELDVREQVRHAYYELYAVQQTIQITEENRGLLETFVQLANSKYKVDMDVSQQDVLRAELQLLDLAQELLRLNQQLQSAQASLAQVLHVSAETNLRVLDKLPPDDIPGDIAQLYTRAVQARPELRAQLAAIQRDRHRVELAKLDYFPDVNLSIDWREMNTSGALSPVADGIDDVGLGLMINVPIYRKRLDAAVREAEQQTVADAGHYDVLRDRTLEQIKDLYARVTSQQELAAMFREDIIPKADQTLQVSRTAYEANEVDFLQLIDNWEKLLRYRIAYVRLEAQLRQNLASLERVVGGALELREEQ